ncbi:MAG: peptidase M23 [Rickettsiales bacterium]|nr:peptidase M23 [Rickettsiales bacterium]|tara:strand:- start:639 stop:1460 length:822 start_codon:yes stop_codon:yes gene_type:complete
MSSIKPTSTLDALQSAGRSDPGAGLAASLRDAAARGDEKQLREAAQKFESYFVQTMLKDMRKTTSIGGESKQDRAMDTWNGLFDQEIADRVAKGRGLGLADMIVRNLKGQSPEQGHAHVLAARTYAGNLPSAVSAPVHREGWAWPLPASEPGRVSSDFGMRHDPHHGHHRHHGGLDVAAPRGTPVLAMADGVVVDAGPRGSYGNFVEVRHSDGVVSRYAHQDRIDVEVGQEVHAGTQLGTVGSTGRSTGNHLHVEVRLDGDPVDPYRFLKGHR